MESYPYLGTDEPADIAKAVRDIVKLRDSDIKDYENLPSRFVGGRSVGRVPASSADVLATDRVGDVSKSGQYIYYLIDNAGTIEWRRTSLSSF